MMTPDELAALEAKMTEGPWHNEGGGIYSGTDNPVAEVYTTDEDANGVVALRNAAPMLIAALLRETRRKDREKAYRRRSEVQERLRTYARERSRRPEEVARRKAYYQTPEYKKKHRIAALASYHRRKPNARTYKKDRAAVRAMEKP